MLVSTRIMIDTVLAVHERAESSIWLQLQATAPTDEANGSDRLQ
jgi:hypothetical protein